MQRKPTSFDIAHLAGVSQPTVSRALRGGTGVNEATRKRIEAIAQKLNYRVDKAASNLRSRHAETLAVLIFQDESADDSAINPFFLSMLGSIMRACADNGQDMLVSFQQLGSDWHQDYEDSRRADGLILLGYGDYELYRAKLNELMAQGTHFVRWGSVQSEGLGLTVGCDNQGGGREATRHAAAESLIASGETFDAILAASDLIAIGAMRALAAHGIKAGEDVAVVGFDDIAAASFTNPPLTTVLQDTRAAGRTLVETLLGRIRDEHVADVLLPAKLVVRRSCGSPG